MIPRLILATTNAHKVRELAAMLAGAGHSREVMSATAFGTPPEIAETSDTFVGNAIQKVTGFASWLREIVELSPDDLCVADDSGICIDALGGAPGVRSARFAGEDATDEGNNAAMVAALRALGLDRSPAHYSCALAVVRADGAPHGTEMSEGALIFEGRCDGEIRVIRQGEGGFGYDPYFWIEGGVRTFADLSDDEKAGRSHRGMALQAMMARWSELSS